MHLYATLAEKELRLIAERRLLYRPHQFNERASRSDNGKWHLRSRRQELPAFKDFGAF
jgi:hypothetical protein